MPQTTMRKLVLRMLEAFLSEGYQGIRVATLYHLLPTVLANLEKNWGFELGTERLRLGEYYPALVVELRKCQDQGLIAGRRIHNNGDLDDVFVSIRDVAKSALSIAIANEETEIFSDEDCALNDAAEAIVIAYNSDHARTDDDDFELRARRRASAQKILAAAPRRTVEQHAPCGARGLCHGHGISLSHSI